jgi:Transmembrane protein 43
MVDRVTRTEHKGFFSRLFNSVVGVLIGFVMVPGSVALMTWNEYRTIHRTQGLIQAEKVVAEAPSPFEPSADLDNRLVHVTGIATTDELLSDGVFDIGKKVLRLERKVEMFQWVESKESRSRDKFGGGKETITTYEYQKKWHEDRVNSQSFEQPNGHENPQPKFTSTSLISDKATLGAFHLRTSLVNRIDAWTDVAIDQATVFSKLAEDERSHYKVDIGYLRYCVSTPAKTDPELGDLRIQFRVVEPTTVSLLSQQKGKEFEPFKTKNGETIESIETGERTAAQMFDSLRFENTALATILRIVGWVLACVGFSMIAAPLKALANVVPLFGKMVGFATMLIGFILGSILALITISVAWIAVRPVFSLTLLAIAGVGIYFVFRRKREQEPPMAVLVEQ